MQFEGFEVGGYGPSQMARENVLRGRVASFGQKLVDKADKYGQADWYAADEDGTWGITYDAKMSLENRRDEIFAKFSTNSQGDDLKLTRDEAKFALTSGTVGTLPLEINQEAFDVARKAVDIVPRIRRFAIGTEQYFWNPITTASVAVGIGPTENPTLTTQDDTYTKCVLTTRGMQAVKVWSDKSGLTTPGRSLQSEFIAAGNRALDVYEESMIIAGTGAGTADTYLGIPTMSTTNGVDKNSSAVILDDLDTCHANLVANSPDGDNADFGITDPTTWNVLAKAIGVSFATPVAGAGERPNSQKTGFTWGGTTYIASPNMPTGANVLRVFMLDLSKLAFGDLLYRSWGEYARTTTLNTYACHSWTAGLIDFSANAAGGTGALSHADIQEIS